MISDHQVAYHGNLPYEPEKKYSVSETLRVMDEHGIDKAIMMPTPTKVIPENEEMAADIANEKRLEGAVLINPWLGKEVLEIIDKSVKGWNFREGIKFLEVKN